jgi:hypothetical protein
MARRLGKTRGFLLNADGSRSFEWECEEGRDPKKRNPKADRRIQPRAPPAQPAQPPPPPPPPFAPDPAPFDLGLEAIFSDEVLGLFADLG